MKLSILIPAYNEERFVQQVISTIKSLDLSTSGIVNKEVILVDDGSTDKTVEKALGIDPEAMVITHTKHKGKGASLVSALSYASGDIVVIQDADLEYSPLLYPVLLAPILKEEADVVYGSRFLYSVHPEKMKMVYYLANRFGAILINLLNGVRLTDPMTCFKVFKKEVISNITLSSNGFGIDAELTAKIIKKGFKIKEVPIPYKARTVEEGKKFHPIYSLGVLWAILRYSILERV